jgi:hypothetical protein
MRASPLLCATLLAAAVATPAPAEVVLRNTNGTKTTVYQSPDKTRRVVLDRYDPYKRSRSDVVQDPKNRYEDLKEQFPAEYARELEFKLKKAQMTEAEKARERALLDRTPINVRNMPSNITERSSIPTRP